MRLRGKIFLCTMWSLFAAEHAAFGQTGRTALVEQWLEQKTEKPSLYQSTPVTQVVPTFNTITYALLAEVIDAQVKPDTTNTFFRADETLTLSGYSVAPHVAISLKRVGLGFSVEAGSREADYYLDGTNVGNQHSAQESELNYRGFGLNAYYILPQPFGRRVKPSLTVGYSSLTAKHSVSTFVYGVGSAVITEDQKELFDYSVARQEVGLNIGIQLLKKFSLIPWANYENMDTSAAQALAEKAEQSGLQSYSATFEEDLQLFWHDRPRVRYGLDFVIRIYKTFDIHVGGLLGSVAALGGGSDTVTDDGMSLSLSIEQKGN